MLKFQLPDKMHKHTFAHYANNVTSIRTTCHMCQADFLLHVPTIEYHVWQSGVLIQDTLTDLTAAERELLISGFCGACFDRLVADER